MDDFKADLAKFNHSRDIVWDPEKCSCCRKEQKANDPFGVFVVLIVRGDNLGEPIVRDGIFDSRGKVAFLKACPDCLPKVSSFHEHQSEINAPDRLPPGPVRTLAYELWKKKNGTLVISPTIFDRLYLKHLARRVNESLQ